MRTRIHARVSLCLMIAAAVALAGAPALIAATPDGASGPPAQKRLAFRFDLDAQGIAAAPVQAATGEAAEFSRLAVRLYGGYSRVAAGDVNLGSDGYFEYFEMYTNVAPDITSAGGYDPVHAGFDGGADFIYQLNRTLGIGLGVGYLRSARESRMSLDVSGVTVLTLRATPSLSAMPISLGLFLTAPLGSKISLTAGARGVYFAGLKYELAQRLEFASPDDWQKDVLSASRSSLSANLGAQGSLGLEYKLSPKMGVFVEAVGRYAKLGNFDKATQTVETDSSANPTTNTGKIYLVAFTSEEWSYDQFVLAETPPAEAPPMLTVREPKFDLSGFSLQVGIRIRL